MDIALRWEAPPPDFAEVSEITPLYRVEPMNPSGPERESLTSLIVRVAREHSVSPRDMVQEVVGSRFPEIRKICKGTFFRHYAAPINGLGRYAALFCQAFEFLTGHSTLHHHTLLPLAGAIASQGSPVIYPGQRWCSTCFQEWIECGVPLYRPLLWSIAMVSRCHRHECELRECCPYCGSTQPILPRWPDIAFCDTCRNPLFFDRIDTDIIDHSVPTSLRQIWNHQACVDLVGHVHAFNGEQSLADFRNVLQVAVMVLCKGNRAEFCRRVGLSIYALGKILRGEDLPSCGTLFRLGFALDLLPSELLLEEFRPAAEHLVLRRSIETNSPARSPRQTKPDENILRDFLLENLPPSVSQIASRLELTRAGLKYRHPVLYAAIVSKRQKRLADEARARSQEREKFLCDFIRRVAAQGIYPGKDMVESALREKGWSLLRTELRRCYYELLIELSRSPGH